MRPVWAEIDLAAIAANVSELKKLSAPAAMCAVVKADGYGHGAVATALAALEGGADVLAVALVGEGAELRSAGIDATVLVLSQASPDELDLLVETDLDATVYTLLGVEALAEAAARAGRGGMDAVRVHLKVDTGMSRVGVQPGDSVELARFIDAQDTLSLQSVFTHCAVADEPDNPFTDHQLARMAEVVDEIELAGIEVPLVHAANSAAAIAHPDARLGLVRCGIAIYGLAPAPALAGRISLRPALSLKAQVSLVKRVPAGTGVSYGLTYTTASETTIATVPLGYADGVPRRLGQLGGRVLIGGRSHPIAGSVTMDQILVDCGDHDVAFGDEVVLLGSQGREVVGAEQWAALLETISYEIVCGVSPRVPRRYEGGSS